MKKNVKFLVFLVLLIQFSACVSKKDIIYFQNDEIDQSKVSNSYKTIIKPDDLLQIVITALDTKAVIPFNLVMVNFSAAGGPAMGMQQQLNYLVDTKGDIDFPVLGKLKVGGKSRQEVIKLLKDKLDPDYVKNPNINIRITNYKVSILGDVGRPGSYTIPNERITILEAIALAGDLNISGQRYDVLVQREENGQKIEYTVNLLSKEIFTSPVYYLQQNDVVYVKHNYAKIQSASANSNTSLFISITSLLVTMVALLIR